MVGNSFYESYIAKFCPNIIIQPYERFGDLVDAAENNEIDAFVNESAFTWFQLVKFNDFVQLDRFYLSNNFYASVIRGDKYSGVIADYISLISEATGIEFKFVAHRRWRDILTSFNDNELDAVFSSAYLVHQLKNSRVSDEFANFQFVIVMGKDELFVGDLNDIKNKIIALSGDAGLIKDIKRHYPELKLLETKNLKQALTLVGKGQADAAIGHFAVVLNQLENNYLDLKIVGVLNLEFSHRILLHQMNPLAMSIINKAISEISPQQRQQIKVRWVNRDIATTVDTRLIYKIIAIFIVILLVISFVFKKLSSAKKQVEQANAKLMLTFSELKEQKEAFETLFYDTSDGLLLMIGSIFIDCNSAALAMLGMSSKTELLNTSLDEISPYRQPDGQISMIKCRQIEQLCRERGHHSFEWVHLKCNGSELWVEVVLTAIKLNQQEVVHVVWRDIADKKLLEKQILNRNEKLELSNHELEHSIADLKKAQTRLVESEKMASLGGLVAGVAHEINTPVGIGVTAISHFGEISGQIKHKFAHNTLSRKDLEAFFEQSTELAKIISRNLGRTAELVKSFKNISVDQSSDERRRFNVSEYMKEILLSIHHITKKTRLEIRLDCEPSLVINSYPGAFSQIISNLIINSTIHGYPANEIGVISITINKTNDTIELIYQDDGKGIASHHLSKIFDPFFTTNREHGGSGLGLNIIYNIVTNRLKGTIDCHSEAGKGVEFIVKFEVE